MITARIPNPVASTIGSVIGSYYYRHKVIEDLFDRAGAPGEPPEGNCVDKSTAWLKRCSSDLSVDALAILGRVLEEFMEVDHLLSFSSHDQLNHERARVREVLNRYGMRYEMGGRIIVVVPKSGLPATSIETMLRNREFASLDHEFQRGLASLDSDPEAALTSACALVESLLRVYIEEEGLDLPKEQSLKPLWKIVSAHLGFDPSQLVDDDLKRILTGLFSIMDGLGALRTHAGSAHGRGQYRYNVKARHARLALNTAHTLTVFVLEVWDSK